MTHGVTFLNTPMRYQRRRKSSASGRIHRRDIILISHASEDNQFARWLTLQLARHGYRAWCDCTKLLGGENLWDNIEYVLRHQAAKFIYVLSRSSNHGAGRGFWKELDLADSESKTNGVADFIVPVAIDDLPTGNYNIFLHTRFATPFYPQWSEGLKLLLRKLEKDRVAKRQAKFNAASVATWWRTWHRNPSAGVNRKLDLCLSSWFPIYRLPRTLYVHHLGAKLNVGDPNCESNWARPAVVSGQRIITFAPASELIGQLDGNNILGTAQMSVAEIVANSVKDSTLEVGELRRLLAWLLRETWDGWIRRQSAVGIYRLANQRQCTFFLKPSDREAFTAPLILADGSRGERALTGFWTRPNPIANEERPKHYWHFGIQARPRLSPQPLYRILTHVVFTDDGKTPWSSKARMHRARRRQCRNWYNDVWRDRLIAAMMAFARPGMAGISIPVSADESLEVSVRPLVFDSPVSFTVISKSTALLSQDRDKEDEDANADGGNDEGDNEVAPEEGEVL